MSTSTQDALKIFLHGEETSGFYIYGLYKNKTSINHETLSGKDFFSHHLFGEGWFVEYLGIATEITEESLSLLNTLLDSMVKNGAAVAWAAVEGYFSEPPELFDDAMVSGMYAVSIPDHEYVCSITSNGEYKSIEKDAISALRQRGYKFFDFVKEF